MSKAIIIGAIASVLMFGEARASVMSIADNYLGMHERSHRGQLKRILGVDPRRTPWCGAFLAYAVKKAGKRPPKGHNLARSWTRFGKAVRLSQAKIGDVVVLTRGRRGGHVGLLHSRKGGKVCLIGGNQSNAVKISCYSPSRVIAVRR